MAACACTAPCCAKGADAMPTPITFGGADGLALENGFIQVDRAMATNLPGVFAAGDCTGRPLQIAKAVGDGNVAALSAAEFLARKK